jgi:hypothetical protein
MEIGKEELFPATPTSEPIPNSNKNLFGTFVTTNRTERTLPWEFQRRCLPEYKKNFLEDDYPTEFRPHRYPDLVDDAICPIVTDLFNALPDNSSVNTNRSNNRRETVFFYVVGAEKKHGYI